ncbi:unnamed protein product [Phytophthora lilii]|uniref:Unnamed protein product n=1 Tax=Phytophthora lilii TaxID=2077276 RepID=A0A9W7CGV9_9STRA|nr:unnamed protein product [Phytophthora lilii]
MAPPKKPKLRTFLTNAQKLQLKRFWNARPELPLPAVVDWVREHFGVSVGRATLYRIYKAPAEAFAGNAQQKKRRRVKFPALERDILAFYEENRRGQGDGAALSDDALLRAAAELRAQHGISGTQLKLSNGWLHRFKERHALRAAPQATGEGNAQMTIENYQAITDRAGMYAECTAAQDSRTKPGRKPRAPQRRRDVIELGVDIAGGDDNVIGGSNEYPGPAEAAGVNIAGTTSSFQDQLMDRRNASVAIERRLGVAANVSAVIRPLTYLSAISMDSVAEVGFVKWRFNSGMAHTEYFAMDSDGVSILSNANYQLNVELRHSAVVAELPPVIFKVWAGVELLGLCECSVRSEGNRALSVLQLECTLAAQTLIRVEYHGPGVVLSGSRLVMRLLNEFT